MLFRYSLPRSSFNRFIMSPVGCFSFLIKRPHILSCLGSLPFKNTYRSWKYIALRPKINYLTDKGIYMNVP